MKRSLLKYIPLISMLILSSGLKAQVGVGTTSPDASSILDLTSTAKGMLVPRLTEAQKISVSSPATGLLIYQTNNAFGFWYFDGTNWIPFLTPQAGWLTTGNSGTVDGTNFLGTLDDAPLYFRVNNTMSGKVSASDLNTFFGFNAGSANSWNGSTFIGYRAGQANTTGSGNSAFGVSALRANTTGTNNTAIGSTSMLVNTTGFDNVGMGENTLYTNSTGAQNTAAGSNTLYSNTTGNGNSSVGQNSLYYNTTGNYNCAVGVNSLRLSTTGLRNASMGYNALNANTTGSNNTASGYTAGSTNTTGSNNTFIGSNSDASAVGLSNVTAIGYSAVAGASNCMVLGGSGANIVKVGIGVASPTNSLSFDGTAARTVWMERNSTAAAAGNNFTLQSGGAYNTGTNLNGGDLNLSSGTSTGTGSSNIYFKTGTAAASGTADNAPSTKMTILANGNAGIGTTAPTSTLQVSGSVAVGVHTQSGVYTFTGSDYAVVNTGGVATWTIPAANTCSGRIYIVCNQGTGAITTSPVYRTASGVTTGNVAIASNVQIISDGTEWRKIN